MEAFWGITLSVLAIRTAWKNRRQRGEHESRRNTVRNRKTSPYKVSAERQKQDEELITVVLPTINNGQ